MSLTFLQIQRRFLMVINRCYICQSRAARAAAAHDHRRLAAAGTTTGMSARCGRLACAHRSSTARAGLYGARTGPYLAILHLQEQGFSLESLGVLFDALEAGRSLAGVLGLPEPTAPSDAGNDTDVDSAELYGFTQLQPATGPRPRGRALLSVVPTTVWDESQAS